MESINRDILYREPEILYHYVEGKLPLAETKRINEILLQDPLLMASVEGIRKFNKYYDKNSFDKVVESSRSTKSLFKRPIVLFLIKSRLKRFFRFTLIIISVLGIIIAFRMLSINDSIKETESIVPFEKTARSSGTVPQRPQYNIPPPVERNLPVPPEPSEEEEELSTETPILDFGEETSPPLVEAEQPEFYPDTSFWSKDYYKGDALVAILTESGLEVKTVHNEPLEMLPTIRVSEGDKFLKQENPRVIIPLSRLKAPGPLPRQLKKGKGES